MTKDKFRQIAHSAVETLMSMPDDLWEDTLPMVVMTVRDTEDGTRHRVIVGLEEVEDGEDGDDS